MTGYLWRVICAAVLCALVGSLGDGGTGRGVRRLTAGLFLALTVLSPLGNVDLPDFDLSRLEADADAAVRAGTDQARAAENAIITEALEAYIWNKAVELGLELQVRVTLDEAGMPRTVELTGMASPLEREELGSSIARELGIGKEAQIWTAMYQSSE